MQETRILTDRAEIAALLPEWNDLVARHATCHFSDFASIDLWMETVGCFEPTSYHITICRRDGRLTGVLPLAVTRKRGLRLLRWVAHDVFYGPVQLFETEADREAMWRATLGSPHYDVAKIKYLFDDTPEKRLIHAMPMVQSAGTDLMTLISFEGKDGEAWLRSLSRSTQNDFKRKSKALEKQGPVTFHVWRAGNVPYERVSSMMDQKKQWARQQDRHSGIFMSPDFTMKLVRLADQNGSICIHELRCGNETVALSIDFIGGDNLYWFITTRNLDWSTFSPGALSIVHIVKWAADNGFSRVHLFEGSDSYKHRYANILNTFETCLFPGSWRGRIALALYALIKRFKR